MEALATYRNLAQDRELSEIKALAKRLSGKHIVMLSSTHQAGGVAEILNRLIPLFNQLDIKVGWRIVHASEDFFNITKEIHNALQGAKIDLTDRKKRIYYETNRAFSAYTHLIHDLVVVHDPQPLPLPIFYRNKHQPWIFRLHVDASRPYRPAWNYLKHFIEKYDHMVVSNQNYIKADLRLKQSVIYPAIDPLSPKNRKLSRQTVSKILARHGIRQDKPILTQVSRFDRWKDPQGVVEIFELVRKKVNCQLVLLGSLALDDPEGQGIFEGMQQFVSRSRYRRDIKVILVSNDLLVNALQRTASVVIQKSLREGFGLVVSEALYKGTPVVASNVGGIPLQVVDGETGFLHEPRDLTGFRDSILKLLAQPKLRRRLGRQGREHVRNNFLITRLVLDWLRIFAEYLKV